MIELRIYRTYKGEPGPQPREHTDTLQFREPEGEWKTVPIVEDRRLPNLRSIWYGVDWDG